METANNSTRVSFVLVNHTRDLTPLVSVFVTNPSPLIFDLQNKAKLRFPTLITCDYVYLSVLRCKNRAELSGLSRDVMSTKVKALLASRANAGVGSPDDPLEYLDRPQRMISVLGLEAEEVLLVQLPGTSRKPDYSTHTDEGSSLDSNANSGSADTDEEEVAELEHRGYEVVPNEIRAGEGRKAITLKALWTYPRNIVVCKAANKLLLAKRIRQGSNEMQFLKLLAAATPPCDHVIQILDAFNTPKNGWVIMPELHSLGDHFLITSSAFCARADQVCTGLLDGLAYLHELLIAHRDIKPGNLVVDGNFCTKIIDFDVASQLNDASDTSTRYCGTKGWTAPEVQKGTPYSPIQADRWACGHTILFFLDKSKRKDDALRNFARDLEAADPQQRPLLRLNWRDCRC
ncbi:cellular response to glucose starvation [Steccherinum ochraceum]|uniref:Cellular response to glucose starvation n=1 Tax=Steccherinum ochraceum TaxID=92696 RepID=A0A4R0RH55_9APHY|nr:cellular response to glucose starvation [Steccherinum ochraceum]